MTTARPGSLARRWPLMVALAAGSTTASGCTMEQVMPAPGCDPGDTVILVAQSVPSAQLVPCFEMLPAGWDVESVRIDQDGTEIRFGSDRAGATSAVFHYVDGCDVGPAVLAPSEHAGAARYDFVERIAERFSAERYYLFDGGCIWWRFDFDAGAAAGLSIELGEQLRTVSRAELNDQIRETFIDEEV
jgi:hypothetical protein